MIKDGFKNVLYRFLKEIASKRKDKEGSESIEEKIRTLKQLQEDGLITKDHCKKAVDKVLDTYSNQSTK